MVELTENVSIVGLDAVRYAAAFIGQKLGVNISIVLGGPSCSDPCGEVAAYIGFRDKHGSAIAISVDHQGRIALAHPKNR